MTDQAPAPATPRWLRWLLAASLALNLLVLGLVVGDALRDGRPGGGLRPTEMALGPFARALADEDRRAILSDLRGRPELAPLGRGERGAAFAGILAAVRAEPFDEARLRAAMAEQSERVEAAQRAVQDAVAARLASLPPQERAAFADRLEGAGRAGPGR